MNIDERLEALTGRHEALAQSIELLTMDVREVQQTARLLLATAQQDGENIRASARIADIHGRRITSLEHGEQ